MREISRWGEGREVSGIGGRLAISMNNNYITRRGVRPNQKVEKKKAARDPQRVGPLCGTQLLKAYFGAAVVSAVLAFLLFLDFLLAAFFLVLVAAFLSAGLSAGVELAAWANDSVVPRARANAIVSSFFNSSLLLREVSFTAITVW